MAAQDRAVRKFLSRQPVQNCMKLTGKVRQNKNHSVSAIPPPANRFDYFPYPYDTQKNLMHICEELRCRVTIRLNIAV